jgi:ketosteroid isomerase-like protein
MKSNKLSYVFVFAFLSHTAFAQYSKEELDVQKQVIDLFEALSNRDAQGLKKLCTADVRFYEYGEAWPVDTLINLAITKNTASDFKRTNQFDFVDTTIQGNTAWTTYNLQSDITKNGQVVSVYWMETVILIQEEKKWKIKVLHSTRLQRD